MLAAAYQAGITAYGYYAAGGRAIVQDVKGENEHNVTFVTPAHQGVGLQRVQIAGAGGYILHFNCPTSQKEEQKMKVSFEQQFLSFPFSNGLLKQPSF